MVDVENEALLIGVPLNVADVSWKVESNVQRYSPGVSELPSTVAPQYKTSGISLHESSLIGVTSPVDAVVSSPMEASGNGVVTHIGSERK